MNNNKGHCPKSPGLRLPGNPPSLHGAPGEHHRPRRGLKIHAILLYYVCNNGQHLSHCKRGGCCPFFCWPPGARTRVSTAYSPIGRGECCFFSFGPRGLTRHQYLPYTTGGDAGLFFLRSPTGPKTTQGQHLPLMKGQDAVLFSVAPPREVCYRNFGWHPFQHSRYRCEPMAASRPRRLQSSHASTHQCLTIGIGVVLDLI